MLLIIIIIASREDGALLPIVSTYSWVFINLIVIIVHKETKNPYLQSDFSKIISGWLKTIVLEVVHGFPSTLQDLSRNIDEV